MNCTKHLDSDHTRVWESTRELIERKHRHLLQAYPDLLKAELHLRAFAEQCEVYLLVHDSSHGAIEAHASGENLARAIVSAFRRAEIQLSKPQHLQNQ